MITCKNALIVAGLMMAALLGSSHAAPKTTVAELRDLKVIGHHFTTTISTNQRTIYVKEPGKARYVVLKISAYLQGGSGKLFTDDFVLRYVHSDGKEDRSRCSAITWAETEKLGEFDKFYAGEGSWVRFDPGRVYLGLAFYIEHDVEFVEICRIGVAESLTYRLGAYDRPYSVFVSTNRGAEMLKKIEDTIRNGGYAVQSTQVLNPDESGTTIHHRDDTETQAREISQRLMTQLGIVPTLKKMNLISEVDLVVWVGKSVGTH